MEEIICIQDEHFVKATSSLIDDRTRVLKHGDMFAIFDRQGDIKALGKGEQGIYYKDTRFVSSLHLSINNTRPLLLNSTIRTDNSLLTVDLTNPFLCPDSLNSFPVPQGALHIFRSKLLLDGTCYEHIRVTNFARRTLEVQIDITYAADFKDIFEVRGLTRKRRGKLLTPQKGPSDLTFGYIGLDQKRRTTRVSCAPVPSNIESDRLRFRFSLEPTEHKDLYINISCEIGERAKSIIRPGKPSYKRAVEHMATGTQLDERCGCAIETSNEEFNRWIRRSQADLVMLTTDTRFGPFPYAGVPWFSTPFGRDAIITAMECLWNNPEFAKGVLLFLADTQAKDLDPSREAEPGKILHEMRQGELANTGEIPFGLYYGTIDATPLYLMLASSYFDRTGDIELVRAIWPNIVLAVEWLDKWGDVDGDGFIEYQAKKGHGLVNQGWKDSDDSVFHEDGTLAEGPIALCEVQAYVYGAKKGIAHLAGLMGEKELAMRLLNSASRLKEQFNNIFWLPDKRTYALGLDGHKRPMKIRTSNAGHTLFTGIAHEDKAHQLRHTLFSKEMFSGWGIRTVAQGEARFNPMSYHNGSVWPHDNAIIGKGLSMYGYKKEALALLNALFDASSYLELKRLPELFCGFIRRPEEGPTLYPVACLPQAWASASVFMLLQAILGIRFQHRRPQVRFEQPTLPSYIESLSIKGLRTREGEIDLTIQRQDNSVNVTVLKKPKDVEIAIVY